MQLLISRKNHHSVLKKNTQNAQKRSQNCIVSSVQAITCYRSSWWYWEIIVAPGTIYTIILRLCIIVTSNNSYVVRKSQFPIWCSKKKPLGETCTMYTQNDTLLLWAKISSTDIQFYSRWGENTAKKSSKMCNRLILYPCNFSIDFGINVGW